MGSAGAWASPGGYLRSGPVVRMDYLPRAREGELRFVMVGSTVHGVEPYTMSAAPGGGWVDACARPPDAATGAPEGATAWPAYPSTLRLQAGPAEGGPEVVASFKADDCAFWKEQQRLKEAEEKKKREEEQKKKEARDRLKQRAAMFN